MGRSRSRTPPRRGEQLGAASLREANVGVNIRMNNVARGDKGENGVENNSSTLKCDFVRANYSFAHSSRQASTTWFKNLYAR